MLRGIFFSFQNDENMAPNTAAAAVPSQSVPNFDVDVHRLLDMLQLPETIDGLLYIFFYLYLMYL